jgi:hypothetical protein
MDETKLSEADRELRAHLLNNGRVTQSIQTLSQLIADRKLVDTEKIMGIADEVMLQLEPQIEQWAKDLWHLYVMKGNVAGEHSLLCEVLHNSKKAFKPAKRGKMGFRQDVQSRYAYIFSPTLAF